MGGGRYGDIVVGEGEECDEEEDEDDWEGEASSHIDENES